MIGYRFLTTEMRSSALEQTLNKFKKGIQYVDIVSAVSKNELTELTTAEADFSDYSMAKFVPASGAATRMFKDLYAFVDSRETTAYVEKFFDNLSSFAFYGELTERLDIENMDLEDLDDRITIANALLNHKMIYGDTPKALITFHTYDDFVTTPIDEQIYEGEQYLDGDVKNLHFTIAEKHEEAFNQYVENILKTKDNLNITYSFQKKHTDTMAVDMANEPFLLENGEVFYRPGGHGSLLDNLNDIEEDIIFIKNIDNVAHRTQVEDTIQSKKLLAAIGIQVKEELDGHVKNLLTDDYDLDEIKEFITNRLKITLKKDLDKKKALWFLDRPLRVAGVVKNEGEPGGGPYIVDNGDYCDLQICETAEINLNDPKQVDILNTAEFFNPVDLVCFVKDYKGEKYNLLDFADADRYFISEKSHEGRPLKALEHPGLWNGAMHNWNTIFVEVPLSTFNPVKSVNDLLKPGHQEKK